MRSTLVTRMPCRTTASASGTLRAWLRTSGRSLAPRLCGRETWTRPSSTRKGGTGMPCRSSALRWEATPREAVTIAAVSSGAKATGGSA